MEGCAAQGLTWPLSWVCWSGHQQGQAGVLAPRVCLGPVVRESQAEHRSLRKLLISCVCALLGLEPKASH